MRTTTVRWWTLAALLLGGAALAQEGGNPASPKNPAAEEKKPSQLEELIARALRDNPDLRVAEAKVQEAEAQLSRARLQVIQKVVAHQHTIEMMESAVKVAEANSMEAEARLRLAEASFKRMGDLRNSKTVAQEALDQAQANRDQARAGIETARATLQASKADLAKAQAELPYLLGKGPKYDKQTEMERGFNALSIALAQGGGKLVEQPRGTVAEKLRKKLDMPISLKFDGDEVLLGDVLDYLQKIADVPSVSMLQRDIKLKGINLQNVTLGAAFQCLEDVAQVQVGVRDYGILVNFKLPADVTRLHDFWKASEKPK